MFNDFDRLSVGHNHDCEDERITNASSSGFLEFKTISEAAKEYEERFMIKPDGVVEDRVVDI